MFPAIDLPKFSEGLSPEAMAGCDAKALMANMGYVYSTWLFKDMSALLSLATTMFTDLNKEFEALKNRFTRIHTQVQQFKTSTSAFLAKNLNANPLQFANNPYSNIDVKSLTGAGHSEALGDDSLVDMLVNRTSEPFSMKVWSPLIPNYQELEKSNNEHEQEVNRLFREKRDLDSIVSDQERQVQEMMKGAGSATLQEMAKEVESLEEQCQKLRSQTGDLQGKSREQLLQMVKEATTKIGDADRQILDEQKALTYVQNQIKSLAEREGDLKTENGQKYLKLLKKEKDMTTFLQNYPQALETTKRELAESQRSVFDVLVATSRDLESIENLPSVTNFKQLESDLELKKRQMQDAQSTAEKLSAEVEQRRQDFENLQNVDVKIKEEIELIKKQMKDMEDELPNFDDVTSVREDGELKKKRMTVERDQLKQQLHQLRKATNALASKYNETRSGIRANEINNKLHALEKEIRTRAAENFAIVECIEDNRRRTNYSLVKRASMNIVAEINSFL